MKTGKLSQTVWKRSVLKQFHTKREEILIPLSAEEACTALRPSPGKVVVTAGASVVSKSVSAGFYALAGAVGHLEAKGAECTGVLVQSFLPEDVQETEVKELAGQMEAACRKLDIQIAGFQAEISPAAREYLVQVTALGTAMPDQLLSLQNIEPGQDLVLCGYVGLEGSLQILEEREAELAGRFAPGFLRQMRSLKEQILKPDILRTARVFGVTAIHPIGSGGIFAALWELSEAARTGLAVDMEKMSIRQETVEICEYYRVNPYQMTSAGSYLMTARNGNALAEVLEGCGVRAVRLGAVTAGNARIVTSGTEQRYLDRPAPDELMLWRAGQMRTETGNAGAAV